MAKTEQISPNQQDEQSPVSPDQSEVNVVRPSDDEHATPEDRQLQLDLKRVETQKTEESASPGKEIY